VPPTIPTCPDEVTPAWVTAALRAGGYDVLVRSVSVTPVGSWTSTMHRLDIEYAWIAAGAPATLIWKCSSADPGIRALGGGYEREVRFYREVAPTARARIPRCFLAEHDAATGEHALLLEDLQPTHRSWTLNEVLSTEETAPVVRELAALHASQWDAEVPNPPRAEVWQRYYDQELGANWDYLSEVVGQETLASLAPYRELVAEWMPRLKAGPQALVHWDTHPGNMLFPRDPDDRPAIIDWQAWRTGAPIRDVAHCLVTSLDINDRRAAEQQLVAEYVLALREQGVHYDSARAFGDYRIAAALQWGAAVNFTRRRALWDDDLRAVIPVRIRRAAAALADMLNG
jgi:thiamine kinase-like enzyme